MRKVVISLPPQDVVAFEKVDATKYYGIAIDNERGFIARERWVEGRWKLYCSRSITNGNQWYYHDNKALDDSLINCMKFLLDKRFSVFEFETPQELFTWLVEKS